MKQTFLSCPWRCRAAAITAAIVIGVLPVGGALADGLLGLYVGGSVGQARVEAATSGVFGVSIPALGAFRENHSAYKVMIGARPISLIGAELAYVDFGHPRVSGLPGPTSADVSISGLAAFGMLYLPVPVVDIYLKAGLARLDSRVRATNCLVDICRTVSLSPTNTGLAAGAGLQLKLASWAVRGEYERFNAAGGNPSLFSVGLTWSFL